jgi:uncharacterized protein YqgC (DUF456 family)
MSNPYAPEPRQFKLVVPVVALLALVIDVVLFATLENKVGADHAAYIAAFIAFILVVVIGKAFKPLLGE